MTTTAPSRKIAIDIDGVLVDFQTPFVKFYNKRHNTSFTTEGMFSYEFWNVFQIPQEELQGEMEDFYLSPAFRVLAPLDGSREAIGQLRKTNYLYVVTSRPDTIHDETIRLLREHFQDSFLRAHFTSHYGGNGSRKNKSDFCLEYGYEIIIEDVADYANECAEKGIDAFILTRPWNRRESLHKNVKRVDTWEEILRHLT